MTRRQLVKIAGASALAQSTARSDAATPYTGPLDGCETKVNMADFDPIVFGHRLYQSAPLKLRFQAQNKRQAELWQKKLHAKVVELLGGFPETRGPLHSQTLEVKEYPAYRREKMVFESRPGSLVLAYLLMPKTAKAPSPSIICITGHGRGVDDIVGIDEGGRDRTTKPPYAHDFAIQVAEQGLAAVAIEPLGFGCRRDPSNKSKGLGQKACEPASGAALLLGQTMIGWRVWDVMRTLDWMETRPELDTKRVGTMGISGGGMVSLFSAALEPRVKAAMVSCYLNTFRDSIMAMPHCVDNYIPGILQWAEMYDVAGLIAPRPFFSEAGKRDPIFPVSASVESFQHIRKVYEVFGVPHLAKQQLLETAHEFGGSEGIPFLVQQLSA